jgi:benzoate-CoA ligase
MRGNWFYTGDNYRMDEQGFFWYAGRTHRLPRVSSQWVSLGEVANALMEDPFVLNAAVVPYKGKDQLETPGAFVILREGIAATPNLTRDLQDFVKERITPHRYPHPIKSDGDVLRTAEGSRYRSSDFLVEMESLVWRLL